MLQKKAKVIRLFNTEGCEVWNITAEEWSRVQAGEMIFIRTIKGELEELRNGIVEDRL